FIQKKTITMLFVLSKKAKILITELDLTKQQGRRGAKTQILTYIASTGARKQFSIVFTI
ncbi:hypothetical protein ACJX0J_025829, partial [Zea mays]